MRFVILIIFYAILGAFFAIMNWPFWALIVVITLFLVYELGSLISTMLFSKNMNKIEKFLAKNKKNDIYYYAYILPTASDEELKAALQKIIHKYKNSKYESIYGAHLALLENDTNKARQFIQPVIHTEVGQYTAALIDTYNGDFTKAANAKFSKPWMNEGILAYIAFFQKDIKAFKEHSSKSIEDARGIQYYANFHNFARLEKELEAT